MGGTPPPSRPGPAKVVATVGTSRRRNVDELVVPWQFERAGLPILLRRTDRAEAGFRSSALTGRSSLGSHNPVVHLDTRACTADLREPAAAAGVLTEVAHPRDRGRVRRWCTRFASPASLPQRAQGSGDLFIDASGMAVVSRRSHQLAPIHSRPHLIRSVGRSSTPTR